ncbi:MAG: helix-turn-helix transcriptional regulator [Oscillospiraceae bacterium]|nr:helix-turn-helix transcriptional regulator [Oscillospiraceae bacterium]
MCIRWGSWNSTVCAVSSSFCWRSCTPTASAVTRSGYQRITDYIRDNLGGDLSLDALSQSLFLSKYYIAHLFQEKTGLSIHQYITKKRLAACVEAMQSGQRVSEVYACLGFLNYSRFYRAFLKEYGCPPSVYLQEHLAPTAAETQAPE